MKRLGLWMLFLLGLAAASGAGGYLWVRVDPETGERRLSDQSPLPAWLMNRVVPGQFVEWEDGRLEPKRTWRPPLDLERTFEPADANRVVFSHERHFAALGAKGTTCETCHTALDERKTWPSLAPSAALEPHKETSLGRFCATCHDGKNRISEIEGAHPPVDAAIFTAFGRTGAKSCQRCHAPKDHGTDFTARHGEAVEYGGSFSCTECHRGAATISRKEVDHARLFFQAQMRLLANPEDDEAFNATLPNNFCAFCHGTDLKAWYDE